MMVHEVSGSFHKTNQGGTAGANSLLSQKTWDKGFFVFPENPKPVRVRMILVSNQRMNGEEKKQ